MLLVSSKRAGRVVAERGMMHSIAGWTAKRLCGEGLPQRSVANEVCAARGADAVADIGYEISDRFSQLVEIHAAPPWLWPALVSAMPVKGWNVEAARAHGQY
jgi:hypothetical protein